MYAPAVTIVGDIAQLTRLFSSANAGANPALPNGRELELALDRAIL